MSTSTNIGTSPNPPDIRMCMDALPAYFRVRATFHFLPNRIYRVYMLPEELLFIEERPTSEARAVLTWLLGGSFLFGLLGGWFGAKHRSRSRPPHEMDRTSLEELLWRVRQGKPHFWAGPGDLHEVRMDPPSFSHTANFLNTSYVGLLRFEHQAAGNYTMELLTIEDLHLAVEYLRRFLHNDLIIHDDLLPTLACQNQHERATRSHLGERPALPDDSLNLRGEAHVRQRQRPQIRQMR